MKLKTLIQNESPTILAGLGCIGFITSVIMTAKVAPKADKILKEMPEESSKLDKAKAIAPIYAPTAGMIMISTACIVGSNRIHRYRYASLLALYSVSERTLQKWQDSVLKEVGRKKYENVREHVYSPEEDPPSSMLMDDERVLFFDVYSGRYFRSDSVETVRRIINDLNDQMFREDFASLNDFYFKIGLPRVEFGDDVGWHISAGTIKANYDSFLKDDRPGVSVSFELKPRSFKDVFRKIR